MKKEEKLNIVKWICFIILGILPVNLGDLEPTFNRCCNQGVNWGSEGLKCNTFPSPISGIPSSQQAICLTVVHICCLRRHRELQCEGGKTAARQDRECVVNREIGGEFFKDCCEACKLGLVSGTMNLGCSMKNYKFGLPWDDAYQSCCVQTNPAPPRRNPQVPFLPQATDAPSDDLPFYPGSSNEDPLENLCNMFPGQLCAHVCNPAPGSYRCSCKDGFELMTDKKSCQLIGPGNDRCANENPCSHICVDSSGGIQCSCRSGYRLGTDQKSCIDVDECALGTHNCDVDTTVCINEDGGFKCMPDPGFPNTIPTARPQLVAGPTKCPRGFVFNPRTSACDDIDECTSQSSCSPPMKCQNTLGSYMCIATSTTNCPPGYIFDTAVNSCKDLDECATNPCRPGFRCLNTLGSYSCQVEERVQQIPNCPSGYKYNQRIQSCEDIDECANNLAECDTRTEKCVNRPGSYECMSNNINPQRMAPGAVSCPAGYKPLPGGKCEDVDECTEDLHACIADTEICINELGSYRCDIVESPEEMPSRSSCPSGFAFDDDYDVCVDIDECQEAEDIGSAICSPAEECKNHDGRYECVALCPIGFEHDDESPGTCKDVDECSKNPCKRNERCVNNEGSYRCESVTISSASASSSVSVDGSGSTIVRANAQVSSDRNLRPSCTAGYRFDTTGKCMDINECAEETHNCTVGVDDCVNTLGGFRCKPLPPCPEGFRRDSSTGRCFDIDECTEGLHECPIESTLCVNAYGGFSCRPFPTCPPGHRYSVPARTCEDIDECTEQTEVCDQEFETCINSVGSYRCVDKPKDCGNGYRYILQSRTCEDIDECRSSTPVCKVAVEDCVNVPGSYRCNLRRTTTTTTTTATTTSTTPATTTVRDRITRCPSGYRRKNRQCVDIDECSESSFLCDADEECVNERGGYRCAARPKPTTVATTTTTTPTTTTPPPQSCPVGYRYSDLSRRCVDTNECVEANPCNPATQTCENTPGSYTCRCRLGYRLNSATQSCDDINECSLNMHDCVSTQRCDNTIGSFSCTRITSCGTGYTFNSQSGRCEDDDECAEGADDCATLGPTWVCRNTVGSFRCEKKKCPPGQRLTRDGVCVKPVTQCDDGYEMGANWKCVDIDECVRNPCPRNHRCTNTAGSYQCAASTPQCGSGYEPNENGQCVDVDECTTGRHDCRPGQACHNRAGGYTCGCMGGFILNQFTKECEDIDECRERICDPSTSTCVNSPGSYRCECKDGFRQKSDNQCIDVDECAETERLCQHRCVNSWGSYKCICDQGYTVAPDNRACYDIDECEQYRERGGNLCMGECVNEPGSYRCSCPAGYKISDNGKACSDIDECAQGNICRPEEMCLNTRGSYRCNAITCPANYARETEHKNRCKRTSLECLPSDNECMRRPISYSFNYLTFTSRIPIPRSSGQLDLFTMRGPNWPTSSVKFDLQFIDARAPKGIKPATADFFNIRRVGFNQCILSLANSVDGPQDIELHLSMDMYHNGVLGGVAVARIYIVVTQYEF